MYSVCLLYSDRPVLVGAERVFVLGTNIGTRCAGGNVSLLSHLQSLPGIVSTGKVSLGLTTLLRTIEIPFACKQ